MHLENVNGYSSIKLFTSDNILDEYNKNDENFSYPFKLGGRSPPHNAYSSLLLI